MANKPLITFGAGFSPAAEGKHPAVLAEVAFDMIGKRGEEELKMIWCFELHGKDDVEKDGTHKVVDVKLFTSVTAGNAVGKLWKSWSASKDPLAQEQLNTYSHYFMDSLLMTDDNGNLILNSDGYVQIQFEDAESLIAHTKSDKFKPSMVGATAIVNIKHNESGNKTYANIDGIFPNAKVDEMGNLILVDGKKVPAFEAEVSPTYKGWHERQAEIAARVAKKAAGNSGSSQTATQQQPTERRKPTF